MGVGPLGSGRAGAGQGCSRFGQLKIWQPPGRPTAHPGLSAPAQACSPAQTPAPTTPQCAIHHQSWLCSAAWTLMLWPGTPQGGLYAPQRRPWDNVMMPSCCRGTQLSPVPEQGLALSHNFLGWDGSSSQAGFPDQGTPPPPHTHALLRAAEPPAVLGLTGWDEAGLLLG